MWNTLEFLTITFQFSPGIPRVENVAVPRTSRFPGEKLWSGEITPWPCWVTLYFDFFFGFEANLTSNDT